MLHPGLARPAAERAAGLYRDHGDALGEYQALVEYAFNWRVDVPEARAALARAQSLQDPGWPAAVVERGLTSEAVIHMTAGRHDAARQCYLQALAVSERDGFDRGARRALLNLADLERAAGRLDEAVRLGQEVRQRLDAEGLIESLETVLANLLGALLEQGQHEAAREVALELQSRIGRLRLEESGWWTMDALALLHLHDGRVALAAQLAGAADAAFEAHGQPQRQPNEAKDRAALAAGLALHLPPEEIERLQAEGRRMDPGSAITRAFDLGLSPSPGTGA
jgi:tetratricopeptide (TPR) repeat protein